MKAFVSDWWTFEYDLAAASWTMAKVMHQAIQSAVAVGTAERSGRWPTDEEFRTVRETAAQEIDAWQRAGDSLEAVALQVYSPLRMSRASKAIAAQFAALLVAESSLQAADLPAYIQDALNYLCTKGNTDAAVAP